MQSNEEDPGTGDRANNATSPKIEVLHSRGDHPKTTRTARTVVEPIHRGNAQPGAKSAVPVAPGTTLRRCVDQVQSEQAAKDKAKGPRAPRESTSSMPTLKKRKNTNTKTE